MAVKGQIAKEQLMNEILNLLGDRAFKYDKDIRVNCTENGELVQIKLAFTAAKVVVEQGADTVVPGNIKPAVTAIPKSEMIDFEAPAAPAPVATPTAEEKQNIKELILKLGL